MFPYFHDFSFVYDNNAVSILYGWQAMCYYYARSSLLCPLQSLLHNLKQSWQYTPDELKFNYFLSSCGFLWEFKEQERTNWKNEILISV